MSPLSDPGGEAGRQGGWPRAARLLRADEFQRVMQRGRRVARGPWFQVLYAPPVAAGTASAMPRLGLIVGKRNAARAVSRNAVKRVWREAFRAVREHLPVGDFVVRLHLRLPELSLRELKRLARTEADRLLQQAPRKIAAGGGR